MPTITPSGGGSGSGGLTTLFDSTLVADAAIIDSGAGGFDTTGNLIAVFWKARTDEAAAGSSVLLRLNGDSGAAYDRIFVQGANATAAANNALAATSWVISAVGNTGAAGLFAKGEAFFYGYGTTENPKTGRAINAIAEQSAANTAVVLYGLGYRSATAISRVSIAPGGGTVLRAGSRLTVVKFF
jgi:hypothetical protein